MAVACSTSAFRTDLDGALARVAALGFDAVDLIVMPGWDHVSPDRLVEDFDAEASRVEELLAAHELTPIAVNCAFGHLHEREDEAANAARIDLVRAVGKLMNRLDVGVGAFFPGRKWSENPWERVLADTAATAREILAVADEAGVTLGIELHYNTPFETVEQARRLLADVPELPITYDPSHFAMQEIPLPETADLLDRATHVHVRDAAPEKMCVPTGTGTVDFAWLAAALKQRDYRGHFSIEYLPNAEGDPGDAILNMRDILAEHWGQC